jgi:hypothetical protein
VATPKQLVEYWKPRLHLEHWDIFVDTRKKCLAEDPEVMASSDCQPNYFEARITIYPPYRKADVRYRKAVVLHELLHCVVEGLHLSGVEALRANVKDQKVLDAHEDHLAAERERVTEHMTKVVWALSGEAPLESKKG